MKREIKFRGYSHIHEWVYGDLNQYPDGETYISENSDGESLSYQVEPDTIGQYTGIKDSKGNKIYEGDILKSPRGNIGQVVFGRAEEECKHREYGRMITDVYTTYGWCFRRADGYICAIDDSILSGELIGNIHDNPELLTNE